MDGKGRKQADGNGYSCRRERSMSQGKTVGLVSSEAERHSWGGGGFQERGSSRNKHSEEKAFGVLL